MTGVEEAATRAFAPDGSPIEAFATLPAGEAGKLLSGWIKPDATVLDLGCGAGRLARVLAGRGHRVTGVDQCAEMLARVPDEVETHLADIEALDLGRRFDVVLLASFLVNTTDVTQRGQFVASCARHVGAGGSVLIQRLDPELVPIAVDAESEGDGVVYSMSDVRYEGTRFDATIGFTIGTDRWEHRYAGDVLDDEALAAALTPHGLHVAGYLDAQRTWVEARRS